MEKYSSLNDFYKKEISKEDLKDVILRAALDLGCNCVNNFEGDTKMTEDVFLPLHFLNDILDKVE